MRPLVADVDVERADGRHGLHHALERVPVRAALRLAAGRCGGGAGGGAVRLLLVKLARDFEAVRTDFRRVEPFEETAPVEK